MLGWASPYVLAKGELQTQTSNDECNMRNNNGPSRAGRVYTIYLWRSHY